MEMLLSRLLGLSLSGGCAVCLVALLSPATRRLCSPQWNYYRWCLPLLLFCLPLARSVRPGAGPSPGPTPALLLPPAGAVIPSVEAALAGEGAALAPAAAGTPPGLATVLVVLWGAGGLLFLLWHCSAYLRFARLLRRCPPVETPGLLEVFEGCRARMGVNARVGLVYCGEIASPLVFGLFRPTLALPAEALDGRELALALEHELIHLRRRDLWFKGLALLVNALHWFNPLAHWMAAGLGRDCELSCDACLTAGLDAGERRRYGRMLLTMLSRGAAGCNGLSASAYQSKRMMKRRLTMILNTTHKRRPVIACLLAAALLSAGILSACAVSPPKAVAAVVPVPSPNRLATLSPASQSGQDSAEPSAAVMPQLTGMGLEAAIAVMLEAGLSFQVNYVEEEGISDVVLRTEPPAGAEAAETAVLTVQSEANPRALFSFDAQAVQYAYERPDGMRVVFTCPPGQVQEEISRTEDLELAPFSPPVDREQSQYLGGLELFWGHTGMDYSGSIGAPVYAVAAGTVTYSRYYGLYGNHIIIDHGNGQQSLYAHCDQRLVSVGDEVTAGQEIASIGQTGAVTGPHLHLEYRVNGQYLDIHEYLNF